MDNCEARSYEVFVELRKNRVIRTYSDDDVPNWCMVVIRPKMPLNLIVYEEGKMQKMLHCEVDVQRWATGAVHKLMRPYGNMDLIMR